MADFGIFSLEVWKLSLDPYCWAVKFAIWIVNKKGVDNPFYFDILVDSLSFLLYLLIVL